MLTQEEKKGIIYNAINSAICIDDQYPSPYSDIAGDGFDAASKLYSSFRKEGKCALDIFRYEGFENFLANKEHLLNNKELMILDWELCPNTPTTYEDSLKILEEAVNNKHVRCVSIYTQNPNDKDILFQISSYSILNKSREEIEEILYKVNEVIIEVLSGQYNETNSDGIDDVEEYIEEKLQKLLKLNSSGFTLADADRKELILKEFNRGISDLIPNLKGKKDVCSEIHNKIHEITSIDEQMLLSYYEIDNNSTVNLNIHNSGKEYSVKSYKGDCLLINNTIVNVLNKDISPEKVFDKITDVICNIENQRSLLISLMIKNILSENLAVCGNGLGHISDKMLLHHWESYGDYKDPDNLIEFLVLCMKEDVAESMRENIKSEKIEQLFSYDEKESHEKANEGDLATFNKVITFMDKKDLTNKTSHKIKTGDIFKLNSKLYSHGKDKEIECKEYLICISQSCECLRPNNKIHNNFAFAYGSDFETKMNTVLKKVENEDSYSIISENEAIMWDDSYLTIHIENNEFNVDKTLKVRIDDKDYELDYLGYLKDFYAQRIVNKIFKNALRIGVDLPHFE